MATAKEGDYCGAVLFMYTSLYVVYRFCTGVSLTNPSSLQCARVSVKEETYGKGVSCICIRSLGC